MKREIKFRVWDNQINQFRTPGTIQLSASGKVFILNKKPFGLETEDLKDIVLNQYTGLKDKNGTEIYEGDILSNGKINLTVIFKKGCFKGLTHNKIHLVEIITHIFEIIGNIRENPELIK